MLGKWNMPQSRSCSSGHATARHAHDSPNQALQRTRPSRRGFIRVSSGGRVAELGSLGDFEFMTPERAIYIEQFPKGSKVRVRDRVFLEMFRQTWRFHDPLQAEQLGFADREAE